jgi:hypothetical protein
MPKTLLTSKTRKDKVEMVKGLLSGKSSLKDHRPHKCLVWYHTDEYYTLENKSLRLTEEEYRAYCKDLDKHYNTHYIILIDCSQPNTPTA